MLYKKVRRHTQDICQALLRAKGPPRAGHRKQAKVGKHGGHCLGQGGQGWSEGRDTGVTLVTPRLRRDTTETRPRTFDACAKRCAASRARSCTVSPTSEPIFLFGSKPLLRRNGTAPACARPKTSQNNAATHTLHGSDGPHSAPMSDLTRAHTALVPRATWQTHVACTRKDAPQRASGLLH